MRRRTLERSSPRLLNQIVGAVGFPDQTARQPFERPLVSPKLTERVGGDFGPHFDHRYHRMQRRASRFENLRGRVSPGKVQVELPPDSDSAFSIVVSGTSSIKRRKTCNRRFAS